MIAVLSIVWDDGDVNAPVSAPRSARALARATLTQDILDTARQHLAVHGAAGLSVRAVARDLGMASSAVYRYVPSRDELLTRLIVAGYDSLGATAEQSEAAAPRSDLRGRWRAVTRAVRDWARAHPHEYALLFGSPVPGYRAPEDTIPPASRVPTLLVALLADGTANGVLPPAEPVTRRVRAAIAPVRTGIPTEVPDDLVVRGLFAWTHLFGAVSFEVFGHTHNVVAETGPEAAAYFDHTMDLVADVVGIPERTRVRA